MKKLFLVLFALLGMLSSCDDNDDNNTPQLPLQSEVTLFDQKAKPVAYINYQDTKPTMYVWDGTPVAYLDGEENIYHFNGQFLGWYVQGVLYHRDGYAIAARQGITRGEILMNNTFVEPVKGVKHVQPVPHVKSPLPVRPKLKDQWSTSVPSLLEYLVKGILETDD